MTDVSVVILAAGKGTRMRSPLPKVLHTLAGKPLIHHAVERALTLSPQQISVVVGHEKDQVIGSFQGQEISWAIQEQQLGTGHAVQCALPSITGEFTLILYGDIPLISPQTIAAIVEEGRKFDLLVLTAVLDDPTGYGRIVRDESGCLSLIVEQKDASAEQLAICEINTGILFARTSVLREALASVRNTNAQGEYYLTDVIEICAKEGRSVTTYSTCVLEEITGVNSREQLHDLERVYQESQARALLKEGVMVMDVKRFDLRGTLYAGVDCRIDPGCLFEGSVVLGDRVVIESCCLIKDCQIGDDVVIRAMSHCENASIGSGSTLGPYARLRPGATLDRDTHIGNFVEIKNSTVGKGSKVNHLSYIGDAEIGRDVNVGAGTITCNYDGANKHLTKIEDNVFIGSNTALIAPITVQQGATVGAGSTLSADVAECSLTLTRAPRKVVENWPRPRKKR